MTQPNTTAPWPPPPDLASLRELVRDADPEQHIAQGAPIDEYDPEAEAILAAIHHLAPGSLVTAQLLPLIEPVWQRSFALSPEALAARRPALLSIAKEIERFFGPDTQPRTRTQILADNEPAP